MDAGFFVVMPSMTGWELYHGMEGQGWLTRWDDVLEAADVMAEARHEAAGASTTVIVETKDRDAAIVSVHAWGRTPYRRSHSSHNGTCFFRG